MLRNKNISGHTEPKSRGVVDLGECDMQIMDQEDVKLISCEVGEEKKTEEDNLDSNRDVGGDGECQRDYLNEQMSGGQVEQESSQHIFDDAPAGFYATKKSPRSRKTKSASPKIDDMLNKSYKLENKPSFQADKHGYSMEKSSEASWVRFEEILKDKSKLEASYSSLKEWSENDGTDMDSQFFRTYSELEKKASLICTPVRQSDWVSFENNADTPQTPIAKKGYSGELSNNYAEEVDYQSRISSSIASPYSNSSTAMLSGVLISDVYDIPDDLSESKKIAKLISLGDDDAPDRNENISYERAEKKSKIHKEHEIFDDFDTDSNFSGEICDLNNIENDSLLRDTRKPFPKEGIFQASSTKKKKESEKTEEDKTPTSVKKSVTRELCLEDNNTTPLDEYPSSLNRTEWIFMYRYPDKKKKFGSRKWLPVRLEVKDDAIKIRGRFESMEILKEIPLHPFFVFTMPVLHSGDGHEKLHSVKLQYVQYKETRKIASKFHLEHIPSYTPVLKIATKDHKAMKEFIDTVDNVVRKIETHRDKGITHRHEEIFIDCDDICQYELDGDGRVKRYNITCQIRLRAFITGIPDLYLFLNDITAYNKQKSRRADGKQPKSSRWIRLENIEYHPSVQVAASDREGGVVFKPPDACSFELMRFRVRNTRDLPLIFKASIDFTTSKSFQIKAECKISGDGRMMKYRRQNIVIRFPVPTTWTSVFVKSRSFGGQKKYVQARADQKTFASGIGRTSRCFIEVSTGNAKYEPEYGSVVWRIGDLPILASGVPADAVQTFDLQVNLPFEIDLPRGYELFAEIEYEIPHAVGSEIQIQEVLLSDGRTPDKWVCYRALYSYKILMNVSNKQRLGSLSSAIE